MELQKIDSFSTRSNNRFSSKASKGTFQEVIRQLERERHQREKDQAFIELLKEKLRENGIEPPQYEQNDEVLDTAENSSLLPDGSAKSLVNLLEQRATLSGEKNTPIIIHYENFSYSERIAQEKVQTVGSALKSMICGSSKKQSVVILHKSTGTLFFACNFLIFGRSDPPGSYDYSSWPPWKFKIEFDEIP